MITFKFNVFNDYFKGRINSYFYLCFAEIQSSSFISRTFSKETQENDVRMTLAVH